MQGSNQEIPNNDLLEMAKNMPVSSCLFQFKCAGYHIFSYFLLKVQPFSAHTTRVKLQNSLPAKHMVVQQCHRDTSGTLSHHIFQLVVYDKGILILKQCLYSRMMHL